jgi:hypothetical protein
LPNLGQEPGLGLLYHQVVAALPLELFLFVFPEVPEVVVVRTEVVMVVAVVPGRTGAAMLVVVVAGEVVVVPS